jgi:hypothetical protein
VANIKQLVENKARLDYPALCKALIEQFGVSETVNWNSILPAPQQQELFGGEVLRFVERHKTHYTKKRQHFANAFLFCVPGRWQPAKKANRTNYQTIY